MEMRADAVVIASYLITLSAPVVAYASIRRARRREYDPHRLIQATLLIICILGVLALEARIRFAGGSGALVALARPDLQRTAHALLGVHISIAVATYLGWGWLVATSWRRYGLRLPGSFSRGHRRIGTLVFGGLCFTAASATAMFVMTFVL